MARVTTFQGVTTPPSLGGWSYVVQSDPSGRRGWFHGSIDLKFPQTTSPDVFSSPLLGECVMTSPDTAKCCVIWYNIQRGNPSNQIMYIGTVNSEIRFVRPGSAEVTHHFALYPPGSDTDGDGIPDEGSPTNAFTVTTRDTRLPQPAAR